MRSVRKYKTEVLQETFFRDNKKKHLGADLSKSSHSKSTNYTHMHTYQDMNRNDFARIDFSIPYTSVFAGAVMSVRRARLRVADGRAVSLSCVATGRLKEMDLAGWQTSSHYERVPAQCSALLKKYTKSHTLETLHLCSCKVNGVSGVLLLLIETMQLKQR